MAIDAAEEIRINRQSTADYLEKADAVMAIKGRRAEDDAPEPVSHQVLNQVLMALHEIDARLRRLEEPLLIAGEAAETGATERVLDAVESEIAAREDGGENARESEDDDEGTLETVSDLPTTEGEKP